MTTVFLFLLSLGEFARYAPANLAHHVPLFSSFRIPSRYTIPFLQFATLTLAWAFRSIVTRYGFPRSARIAVGIIALGASAHLISVNQWNLRGVFTETPFDTSFHWMQGPRQITTLADASPYTPGSPMLRALMEDRSFFTCYESLQLAHGSGADRPLVFDANPGERVRDLDFSPNELTLRDRGWRRRRARDPESELGAGMDEHGRIDRGPEADGAGVGDGAARTKRPVHVHVPAASVGHGSGAVRRGADRHAAAVAAPVATCFLGSATLFLRWLRHHDGDCIALRRHGEPRDRAELMRRGVEHLGPTRALPASTT